MTKYSVPSFGGHIDFSDDVTINPFLVMSRTVRRLLVCSTSCSNILLYIYMCIYNRISFYSNSFFSVLTS